MIERHIRDLGESKGSFNDLLAPESAPESASERVASERALKDVEALAEFLKNSKTLDKSRLL
jgi:hypothetical protein